jgi:hypothetical protein
MNYYKQYLVNQILELKANKGSKTEIQKLQQKLDKANNKANEVNKDNNEL